MGNLSHLNRILVVEDEALILMDTTEALLEAQAMSVAGVMTPHEAMAALDAAVCDAAVLDLHLGRHGWTYEIARRLRTLNVPFIFTSGTADVEAEFGHVPLVTKPYSAAQIVAALLRVSPRDTEATE